MALNRDKFRKIVGGITSDPQETAAAEAAQPQAEIATPEPLPAAGQGGEPAEKSASPGETNTDDRRRFAKRGRPKGRKDAAPVSKGPKVKVSLFLSEIIVNDLYDWAHQDKIHPGEMFERALKPFHDRESKRRNGGKE